MKYHASERLSWKCNKECEMSHKFMGIGLWYLCKRVDAKQVKLNIKYINQVTGKVKVLRSDKEAIFLVAEATLQN